jgi:hypothetical protein
VDVKFSKPVFRFNTTLVLEGALALVLVLIPHSIRLQLILTPTMLRSPGMITLGMTFISGTLDSRPTSRLLTNLISVPIVGLVGTVFWRGF